MTDRLEGHRDFYARYIVASTGTSNVRLVEAFRSVRRELYLGEGPWLAYTPQGYVSTMSDDPAFVYQDLAIALLAGKQINNGQPTLHAKCLVALDPQPGERVLHIGVGTGYYTSVLRELVGEAGVVHAFELEPALAKRALDLLGRYTNVHVHAESGSARPLPKADVVYVNAGVTHVDARWLDAMDIRARMLLPLTPDEGFGGMLMVKRTAADTYPARIVARVAFIACTGNRTEAEGRALAAAFASSNPNEVRSLHRGTVPDDSAWFVGDGWWLSTRPAGPA